MKKIFFLLSFCATLLIGCDKEISLVLDNNEPVLVIDGSITDQAGPYFVQLSMTSPINNPTRIVGVNNARVIITDQSGVKDSLEFVSNGLYRTKKIKQKECTVLGILACTMCMVEKMLFVLASKMIPTILREHKLLEPHFLDGCQV